MPMEEGGPHVSIVVAQVDGYGVELERTFFLGEAPEAAKKPCIYREGEGGLRHSDTVLITDEVYIRLTNAPETLAELVIPL